MLFVNVARAAGDGVQGHSSHRYYLDLLLIWRSGNDELDRHVADRNSGAPGIRVSKSAPRSVFGPRISNDLVASLVR
jgi:hypothetical protein